MLAAEKEALEQYALQQTMAIREKLLNYFTENTTAIATQAALIAGFALSAQTSISIPVYECDDNADDGSYACDHEGEPTQPYQTFCFNVCCTLCLATSVYCVMSATFVTVWGPGLALRGKSGSAVSRAIDGFFEERKRIFKSFVISVACFVLAAIATAWLTMTTYGASTCSFLLAVCGYCMQKNGKRVYDRFRWKSERDDEEHTDKDYQFGFTDPNFAGLHRMKAEAISMNSAGMEKSSLSTEKGGASEDKASGSKTSFFGKGFRSTAGPQVSQPANGSNRATWQSSPASVNSAEGVNRRNSYTPPKFSNAAESKGSAPLVTGSPGSPMSNALHVGFMEKKASRPGILGDSWKRYYFAVYERGLVEYYKSQQDFEQRKRPVINRPIMLQGYSVVDPAEQADLTFKLVPRSEDDERRVWEFRVASQTERDSWLAVIRAGIIAADDAAANGRR